jgi:hypothetical protein
MESAFICSRRLIPGPSEAVFIFLLIIILIGGRHALFNDPGTLWHLRLGRDILATGTVPRCDHLTFTRTNTPWVDQSWGFDVLLALLVVHAGWSSVVALTVLLLAGVYAAMARGLISDGISPVTAVVVTLLMAAIGSVHFLIRPHVFTLALVYVTLRVCQKQHEQGGWIVFWVPVYTAILANLHGGFLALPVIVATAALGHAVAGPWDRGRQGNVTRFGLAFASSSLAALINPYGLGLYHHVANLLVSSGVTGLIDEYQPAPFGSGKTRVLELVVLALIGLPAVALRRVDRSQLVHVLVWLHLALTSIRHAPLFGLAAAPVLAALIDGLPMSFQTLWTENRKQSLGIPAAVAIVLFLVCSGVSLGGYDGQQWPLTAVETLNRQPLGSHLFHEQDWGGLIEAECRPERLAYIDDRYELFGREALLQYLDVLTGGPAWDKLRDREGINLVWLKPDRGLAKRLSAEPDWVVLHRDCVSVLYGRKDVNDPAARPPGSKSENPRWVQ